jgi:serine/threonine protein kinase
MMENGVAKLADFGLARDMKVDPTQRANNNNEGTGRYRAPELSSFSMTQMVDVRNADMYALGKTMWVLLTGYVDAKNKLTWQEWQWSAELAAMIKSTMVEEAKRASATTVLANPWWNQA